MRWHVLTRLSLSVLGLAAGCETSRSGLVSSVVPPPPPVASAGDGISQARAQKPDRPGSPNPPSSILASMNPPRVEMGAYTDQAARIGAVVNGEVILDQEIYFTAVTNYGLHYGHSQADQERLKQMALEHIIERELLLQEAITRLSKGPAQKFLDKLKEAAGKEYDKYQQRRFQSAKIKDEDTIQKILEANKDRVSLERRQFEHDFMAHEFVRSQLDPHLQMIGHVQIQEYYDTHPEEFRVVDSVDWQDLFIAAARFPRREAARNFAEVLAERARQGQDFVALGKQWDNGDSKYRPEAAGQGHKHGEISPAVCENDLFQMREGEIRLVATDGGYHVIRLLKRQRPGLMPFDSAVQKQIKDKLRAEIVNREKKRIVNDLKRTAVIDIAPTGN